MTLKKALSVLLMTLFIVVGKLQAQTASFNFSSAPQPVSGWTNVYGSPASAVRTGTSYGITVTSVATTNWVPTSNGISSALDGGGAANGTFFPAAVMANFWFQVNGSLSGYNALVPQLKLSGLNKDSLYTIRMTTSYAQDIGTVFELNPVHYTVTGAVVYNSIDVNGDYNTADGATFTGITPDPNGVVQVYVNTFGTSNVAGISGIQIISQHAAASTPVVTMTRPSNNSVVIEGVSVTINATATEAGGAISKVEFFVDTTKIGEDATSPYSQVWTANDPGTYQVKAKATDVNGISTTATINVTVQSGNYFWSTTGNIATGADSSFIGTVDTNDLAFRTNNIERMRILKDGAITIPGTGLAIGTSQIPTGYMLAVKGSGLFTHLQVKSVANWPDYVFEKKYQLGTLEDLETYIEKHKHLPDVASLAKVNAEGVDLGANQAAILKNVEELALHLIGENKQLKSQSAKTAELQQKLADQNKQINEQNARFADLQRQIDALKALLNKPNN